MLQSKGAEDPEWIARTLGGLLRDTYRDSGVTISIAAETVTIARGRRAAQIKAIDAERVVEGKRFRVSLRTNETYRMHPELVGNAVMARLVEDAIGEPGALDSSPPQPLLRKSLLPKSLLPKSLLPKPLSGRLPRPSRFISGEGHPRGS